MQIVIITVFGWYLKCRAFTVSRGNVVRVLARVSRREHLKIQSLEMIES